MTIRLQMMTLLLCSALAAPAAADPPKKGKGKPPPAKAKTPKKTAPAKAKAPGKTAPKDTATKAKPGAKKPAGNPYRRLKVVVPKDKLPPLRSVRVRTKQEAEDRSRTGTIKVSISSKPKGARVTYGGKLLGTTPFSITAKRGSTPLDVVVKRGGYTVLRTRVRRKVNRSYVFRLTPAKIR